MAIIRSNMAGTVWKVVVSEGETISEGQDVVILESMKMEIPIESDVSGVVTGIKVNEGDFVNKEDELLVVKLL